VNKKCSGLSFDKSGKSLIRISGMIFIFTALFLP
jgi:hypothetical protein